MSLSSQKYGFGIRDPAKNLFRIPDPGVKNAPDPGSATLLYERTTTKLTFSAMQASRGFLVSGQAQHGFSFLPSGPAPERKTAFQIRIGSEAKSVPPKMKKFHVWRVLCWAGGFTWSLNALCMGLRSFSNLLLHAQSANTENLLPHALCKLIICNRMDRVG